MALSNDLINFDLIENHKENIQSLPGGRSARQLASILSPLPIGKAANSPTFDETKTLNDAIRQEYELELQSIADSDDPLDIYDRYVKWTLNAYPSAQSTPQSQLLPLLERATKAFLTSSHYKNDPRYLKLWLHYIRLFSDTPRETFAFLARHNIAEGLGLFYEEFAAWLEGAGRWKQAEEVYRLGIEREARPAERLMRKYDEFTKRYESQPQASDEPSSPALPLMRPALAAKVDPFAAAQHSEDQQSGRATTSTSITTTARSGKPKMAIFSDVDNAIAAPASGTTNGWDSISSMKERRKENTIEARPWVGETLKAGKKVGTTSKMEVFKDPNLPNNRIKRVQPSNSTNVVSQPSKRIERRFADIGAIYPNEHEEYSFEELRSIRRGWSDRDWMKSHSRHLKEVSGNAQRSPESLQTTENTDIENLSVSFQTKLEMKDSSSEANVEMSNVKPTKQKHLKLREVKQEVRTVKTRLESPTGPKIRRKNSSEPTMTFHSKAATNEIYDMFNQPLRSLPKEDTQSGEDTDFGDDTYSTAGESTGTGRISGTNSDYGEETSTSFRMDQMENSDSQQDSVSPWSDFTASKHLPRASVKAKTSRKHNHISSDEITESMSSSQNQTYNTGVIGAFDTQAIAEIANQDLGEFDTKMIASLAGDDFDEVDEEEEQDSEIYNQKQDLKTPTEEFLPTIVEVQNKPRYVPLPPEDYEPTPLRSYRNPNEVAQNRLPFMTPIVERTESSLAPSTVFNEKDYFSSKTPCRLNHNKSSTDESPSKLNVDALLLSSPERTSPSSVKRKIADRDIKEVDTITSSPQKKTPSKLAFLREEETSKHQALHQGLIITDLQCNPCDPAIRDQVLSSINPPLHSYMGYQDHSSQNLGFYGTMKSFTDKISKQKGSNKSSPRKSQSEKTLTKAVPPILKLNGSTRVYAVKRELGKGAFAPVYLVDSYDPEESENSDDQNDNEQPLNGSSKFPQSAAIGKQGREDLEALKAECPPGTLVWEFHILRLLNDRLGSRSRSVQSIINAHECHLYRDEAYLILSYSPQGTILDLVNLARGENIRAGKPAEGLDEVLAMWFSVELLRLLASIHKVGIIHGDLKADNFLVRFDTNTELTSPYNSDGNFGWNQKGLKLIDFGRGIDIHNFDPRVKFVADWEASPQDCVEIRDCRPWTWQIDYHGAAGVMHSLLFGKYIETVPVSMTASNTGASESLTNGFNDSIGQKKEWKLKEPFKRYWERDLWTEMFHLLLNPTLALGGDSGDEREQMPIHRNIERIQTKMEDWLAKEGEKGNRDLRASIRRAERLVGESGKVKK